MSSHSAGRPGYILASAGHQACQANEHSLFCAQVPLQVGQMNRLFLFRVSAAILRQHSAAKYKHKHSYYIQHL